MYHAPGRLRVKPWIICEVQPWCSHSKRGKHTHISCMTPSWTSRGPWGRCWPPRAIPSGKRLSHMGNKRRIYLVGIGTSWHAALIAEHWFRRFAQGAPEVQAWHSFEFYSYPPALSPEDAVIVISHRGTKTYSFLALELAKSCGAFTLAVTSTNPGPRIRVADLEINTVEQERSAAFTVSYTSALTVLAMIAANLGGSPGGTDPAALRARLQDVPGQIAQALAKEEEIREAAERFQGASRFLTVAWGPNTANAYEAALKMKETSAVDCEGLQTEQILHGPFCSVNQDCLVTLVAPPGPGYQRSLDIARASSAVGASVWALVQQGDDQLSAEAGNAFQLPEMPELWSPLVYVAPIQLFTYHLALARNAHPDLFQQNNPRQAAARREYNL